MGVNARDIDCEGADPPRVVEVECNCTIGILVASIISFVIGYLIATFAGR